MRQVLKLEGKYKASWLNDKRGDDHVSGTGLAASFGIHHILTSVAI